MAELRWTTTRIAELTGARIEGADDRRIDRVVIDSRGDVRGALFVALAGERFDGHDFVADAFAAGAVAALVERSAPVTGGIQLVVGDSLAALQQLGRARRREFDVLETGLNPRACRDDLSLQHLMRKPTDGCLG